MVAIQQDYERGVIEQGMIPAVRYRADSEAYIFAPGDLVTFNGHTGKVSGHKDGKAIVTFGINRRRELSESDLQAFVPWYSERD